MKQARFPGNSTVEIVDVDKPVPGPGEVLVDIRASALCGSDMKAYREGTDGPVGHETMGVVAETGPESHFKVGDRVSIFAIGGCGECSACLNGALGHCPNIYVVSGGHGEFLVAPDKNCIPVPDDIPDDEAVIVLGDTLGVSYHANTRLQVQPDEWVVVTGVGPVGLGATILYSHLGAKVIAVDKSAYRLNLAASIGACETVNVGDCDPLERVMELTDGRGADACAECAGNETTLNLCLNAAAYRARVVVCGENHAATINPSAQLLWKDLTVFGSSYYRLTEVDAMVDLYRCGIPVSKVITHRFPLEETGTAYEKFAAGETGKVMLLP